MGTLAADWREITGDRNILVLATRPGDEAERFGGLIARACAVGRPPFVAVLTDGSAAPGGACHAQAMRRERQTRTAVGCLGLDEDRLLFVGLIEGRVPGNGLGDALGESPMFDAVVAALDLVMWRNDCHVLCADGRGDADTARALRLAQAVAMRTGLALVVRTDAADAMVLDTGPVRQAVAAACLAHGAAGGSGREAYTVGP